MNGAEFGVRWIHIQADIGSCWSGDRYYDLNCVFPCSWDVPYNGSSGPAGAEMVTRLVHVKEEIVDVWSGDHSRL